MTLCSIKHLIATTCLLLIGNQALAQGNFARPTNTARLRNALPVTATSSVDLNVCDLWFTRSAGGRNQFSFPEPVNSKADLIDTPQPASTDYAATGSGRTYVSGVRTNETASGSLSGVKSTSGPPPIKIFTCANGYGWMPQAGANAPSVAGGNITGTGPGAIQWTNSWSP